MAFKNNDIYALLNATTNEMVGGTTVAVKDTASFIALGNEILSDVVKTEEFYGKLGNVISKTIARAMVLSDADDEDLIKDTTTFGDILRIIKVKTVGRATKNNSWNTNSVSGSPEQVNPFTVKLKDTTDIAVKYYATRGTWEADPKVIYDYQLDKAFRSEAEMSAFVNLIFVDQKNSMILAKKDLKKLIIATGAAAALQDEVVPTHPLTHRNLISEWNDAHATDTVTVATCKEHVAFLKYAVSEITKVHKKMQDSYPVTFYNSQGYETTVQGSLAVRVHTDFAEAIKVNMQSDIYHKDLVELPNYKEVIAWQSEGVYGAFEDTSKIHITCDYSGASGAGEEIAVEQGGVIAYLYDTYRHGVTYDRMRNKSIYNPASECTTYFAKADYGAYVDSSYDGVVFYLEDENAVSS